MDGWEIALLAMAGYVAVAALVRLMLARRNSRLEDLRTQMEQARRRKKQSKAPNANKPPAAKTAAEKAA